MHSLATLVTLTSHHYIFYYFFANSGKKVTDFQGLEMGLSKFKVIRNAQTL